MAPLVRLPRRREFGANVRICRLLLLQVLFVGDASIVFVFVFFLGDTILLLALCERPTAAIKVNEPTRSSQTWAVRFQDATILG